MQISKGYSLAELERKTGVSRTVLSRTENGQGIGVLSERTPRGSARIVPEWVQEVRHSTGKTQPENVGNTSDTVLQSNDCVSLASRRGIAAFGSVSDTDSIANRYEKQVKPLSEEPLVFKTRALAVNAADYIGSYGYSPPVMASAARILLNLIQYDPHIPTEDIPKVTIQNAIARQKRPAQGRVAGSPQRQVHELKAQALEHFLNANRSEAIAAGRAAKSR